jgi:hypothetical protein
MPTRLAPPELSVIDRRREDLRAMTPYASSQTRRTAALVTLGVVGASQIVSLVTMFGRLVLVQWVSGGRTASEDLARLSDSAVACSAILQLLVQIPCVIAFTMWFHRVYRNLPVLGATELELTPAKAVGSFFIPFANLFVPYGAMREIWRHSQMPTAAPMAEPADTPRPIRLWWLSFIAGNILGNISAVLPKFIQGLSGLRWSTIVMLASDALAALAAVAAMRLVKRLSAQQDALHVHVERERARLAREGAFALDASLPLAPHESPMS